LGEEIKNLSKLKDPDSKMKERDLKNKWKIVKHKMAERLIELVSQDSSLQSRLDSIRKYISDLILQLKKEKLDKETKLGEEYRHLKLTEEEEKLFKQTQIARYEQQTRDLPILEKRAFRSSKNLRVCSVLENFLQR
jgi:hypothetical protein